MYGIGSCDTCRKARRWMASQGIDYVWADLRQRPPAPETVARWLREAGAVGIVNRRSTTWRELPEDQRPDLDFDGWADFLLAHPTLIKRPVIDSGARVCVGFDDAARAWLTTR
jgi:Spx/MgsR family transcriptional regulator